ncbi:TVP38/TMEM64 family protein [Roseiconus nitratireducens]|uniref:TVP38/TMEM64 family protein n=1 Tax=Roseiconus nitratireducens TaxID=2605748 RepID=UPI001F42FF14|nr:TVP38/TMEM64 family protein [Roseiconus nitratireducens]
MTRSPDSAAESETSCPSEKHADRWKVGVFVVLAVVLAVAGYFLRDVITLQTLADKEASLRAYQSAHPIVTYGVAFLVYVTVTGLSLPGATPLTLLYGWYFGLGPGVLLVSFASTAGATLAFLSSRYLLRDAVESRYGESMRTFRRRLESEGAFYLFTLRLIPAFPFFVINLVMGLTPIGVWTYWWVSQLGMLAGTAVYVYAGSRVPNLEVLAEQGAAAVFAPGQLLQLAVAFSLLGVFPLAVRRLMQRFRSQPVRVDGERDPRGRVDDRPD